MERGSMKTGTRLLAPLVILMAKLLLNTLVILQYWGWFLSGLFPTTHPTYGKILLSIVVLGIGYTALTLLEKPHLLRNDYNIRQGLLGLVGILFYWGFGYMIHTLF